MNDISKITKEQFLDAYNKHLPNGWIKFAYKYFSDETTAKNMALNNTIVFVLMGLFAVGFFATLFSAIKSVIALVTILYSTILSTLVLYLFSAVFFNNNRINKIRKDLGGISKAEYNKLVDMYYL
jgi:predicted membrane channel-forming protein YqfA (hemolysin III family)